MSKNLLAILFAIVTLFASATTVLAESIELAGVDYYANDEVVVAVWNWTLDEADVNIPVVQIGAILEAKGFASVPFDAIDSGKKMVVVGVHGRDVSVTLNLAESVVPFKDGWKEHVDRALGRFI